MSLPLHSRRRISASVRLIQNLLDFHPHGHRNLLGGGALCSACVQASKAVRDPLVDTEEQSLSGLKSDASQHGREIAVGVLQKMKGQPINCTLVSRGHFSQAAFSMARHQPHRRFMTGETPAVSGCSGAAA